MGFTPADPKTATARAFLTDDAHVDELGDALTVRGRPGGMIPSVDGRGRTVGFSLACPACGVWGGISFVAYDHFKRPWRVTGGGVDDVTTLSVRDSIRTGCCGWHGYLTDGVFAPC